MARAEINKFRKSGARKSASASHSTSTGGSPTKLKKGGGKKQRGGRVKGVGK